MTNLIPGVYLVAGPCSRPKLNDDISGEEAESSVEEEKEKEEDALRKKSLLAALDAKWAAENSQDGTAIPIKTLLNFIHMYLPTLWQRSPFLLNFTHLPWQVAPSRRRHRRRRLRGFLTVRPSSPIS